MRMNPSAARTRLGLALAISAGTLAAAAPAALAAPAVTLTPATNLRQAGEEVTLRGTGFAAPDVTTGFYIAQTAVVEGTLVYGGRAVWVRSADIVDGAFEARFTAARNVTMARADRTTVAVDCVVTRCAISTWQERTNPTEGSLFTANAITFGASPNIVVSQTSGLSRDGETEITINGTGFEPIFNPTGDGLYLAFGPRPTAFPVSAEDNALFGRTTWVASRPGAFVPLNADGSFTTTFRVSGSYLAGRDRTTPVDCLNQLVRQCGVYTWAAHGANAYRDFDTSTQVTFRPLPVKVEVSPTTGLSRVAATTVTVRGADFATLSYVSQTAIVDGRVVTPSGRSSARYLRINGPTPEETMNPDGSFTTTVTVNPVFTTETGQTVDCRVIQCAVSTWRHQSFATPETLYSSTALAFQPLNPSVPNIPVRPPVTPPALAPKAVVFKKAQTVGKSRTVQIGRVTSNVDATVSTPKSVKVKIGKKRYSLTISAPKSVKAGKSATVKVKLSKKALAALKGRTVKVSVSVKLTANGRESTVKTTGKITAKKAKKAAKKG